MFCSFFFQPKDAILRELVLEEYIGTGEDRVKNRDGFTELLGDMILNIPAIKTAIAHRGIYHANILRNHC